MQVKQLVLEDATEHAGSVDVLDVLSVEMEIGLGVCNPQSSEIESVDFIVDKVTELLQHCKPNQIYLNPDCGSGTFAEHPVNTTEVATATLHTIVQAANVLRARFA